ncbi:MAG: hypothetical protein EAZ94_31110 [Oscillatoriales cyanobacterium]|nr:MAG: hypothetical protein EAZ94_31110 [Oscillatoriales cyanobacterium]
MVRLGNFEGRGKKEEGRRKKEEGRRKKEEGRRKKEEGRRKKEEVYISTILLATHLRNENLITYTLKSGMGVPPVLYRPIRFT